MMIEELYPAMFKRKSVRKFQQEALDERMIQSILERAKEFIALDVTIKTDMQSMGSGSVKGLFSIKAPHYLLFFSEEKDGYLENAGFILQQMDLLLSASGIGSCWLGLAKPTDKNLKNSALGYVVALAIGKPSEPLHRQSEAEFKRKVLKEIVKGETHASIMEAVRLAPSGTNSQPWFFVEKENILRAFCVKKGILKALFYDRLNRIDMGIALCHLWIAATHHGYQADFFQEDLKAEEIPAGYEYIYSVKLK